MSNFQWNDPPFGHRWAKNDEEFIKINLHNPDRGLPHFSEIIDWPADRWDPMLNAPTRGYPILHIRVKAKDGKIYEPVHKANGDGDGMMPPFDGWFRPDGYDGYVQIPTPICWQPLKVVRS